MAADVCLVLEGTYPFVAGGVSAWTHQLIQAHSDLSFHLVCLMPPGADQVRRYELPGNVVGMEVVTVQELAPGRRHARGLAGFLGQLEEPLSLFDDARGDEGLESLLKALEGQPVERLGAETLLNSRPAWQILLRRYEARYPDASFLDFFWSWRALMGGLFSVLLAPMPRAAVYHAVSTGYAGLFLARARQQTGRPALLTEHGIYTNERRIEIALADWLYEVPESGMSVEERPSQLREMWVNTFLSYSRCTYAAADEIITLFEGNQAFQLQDNAPEEKLRVIPNGVDPTRFAQLESRPHPPTMALIGRVVPIKDIKTFLRAVAMVRDRIPDARALVMGPTDEDPEYFQECQDMVAYLGVGDAVTFTGGVRLEDYLPEVDVIVLTSISEGQPLVILEAGSAGIPTVATDVGACRDIIEGDGREAEDPLPPGGVITPLSNPSATADGVANLLQDRARYQQCSQAIRERIRRHYDKRDLDAVYRQLYDHYRMAPGRGPG